jgi:hypothetical protein
VNQHPGNVQFREWVNKRKYDYNTTNNPEQKALICRQVIAQVTQQDPPGRFLARQGSCSWWVELDDARVMTKTGQALREGGPQIREAAALTSHGTTQLAGRGTDSATPDEEEAAAAVEYKPRETAVTYEDVLNPLEDGVGSSPPRLASSPEQPAPEISTLAHPSGTPSPEAMRRDSLLRSVATDAGRSSLLHDDAAATLHQPRNSMAVGWDDVVLKVFGEDTTTAPPSASGSQAQPAEPPMAGLQEGVSRATFDILQDESPDPPTNARSDGDSTEFIGTPELLALCLEHMNSELLPTPREPSHDKAGSYTHPFSQAEDATEDKKPSPDEDNNRPSQELKDDTPPSVATWTVPSLGQVMMSYAAQDGRRLLSGSSSDDENEPLPWEPGHPGGLLSPPMSPILSSHDLIVNKPRSSDSKGKGQPAIVKSPPAHMDQVASVDARPRGKDFAAIKARALRLSQNAAVADDSEDKKPSPVQDTSTEASDSGASSVAATAVDAARTTVPPAWLTGKIIMTAEGPAMLLNSNPSLAGMIHPGAPPPPKKNMHWSKAEDKLLVTATTEEPGPPYDWEEISETYFHGFRTANLVRLSLPLLANHARLVLTLSSVYFLLTF